MNNQPIINITTYRFVSLLEQQLLDWQRLFKNKALTCGLKGTILLSQEGINLFLAGASENVTIFRDFLQQFPELNDLTYRESWSDHQPFKRLLVRLKKEIISMGRAHIQPENETVPYIEPEILHEWYQQGRKMLVLDTRNQYEVECGTFAEALDLKLKNFRSFPDAAMELPAEARQMPVVTFCTGGIRCEKAALWLHKQGYEQVYQLRGGILNYFEQCGRDYFHGDCFVFDERVTV